MSIFAYTSGNTDQIGGTIELPPTLTHLPRFQGEDFTLPPGLSVTGGRAFIWELAKPYNGVVGITNPEADTPTINFDASAFSEPFIEIICRVKGQPLNFLTYFIFTSLSTTFKAGTTHWSSVEFEDYNIKDESFTIDNAIIIESNLANNIQSGLILYWKPPAFGNVKHYKIEKWGKGWEYIGISPRPSYIIPKQEITYRVTPIYLEYKPGIEQSRTIPVLPEGILSKDILSIYQDHFAYNNVKTPKSTDIFYTRFRNFDYTGKSIIYQDHFTYDPINQPTNSYTNTFWIQVEKYFDEDNISIYQDHFDVEVTQSTNTYPEVFWSKGIGI